ncbi:MAG TPA: ribosome silencing factor [Acidimicrobiales bacterium]|nr:ribosome silencing factor [Acidimicrobiales bacterium]
MADEATTPVDLDTGDLAVLAARAADDKQGERTVILQVGDLLGITEMFVISSASNVRLVRAVVQEVEHRLTIEAGRKPQRVEGLDDARWVLMDYGDWVVHVFLEEARAFYDLERLWADVPRLPWSPDA